MNNLVKVLLICFIVAVIATTIIAGLLLVQHFAMLGVLTYEFSQFSSESKSSFFGLLGYVTTLVGIQGIGYSIVTLFKDTITEMSYRISKSLEQSKAAK